MSFYELWDCQTGNLRGSYGSELEALALVRDLVAGGHASEHLELVWGDEEREGTVAASDDLVARAQAATPRSA